MSESAYKSIHWQWMIFILAACANIALWWPGMMSDDSLTIYSEVLSNRYSDHHPPLMALVWHYANMIYSGPLLMYLINMAMLWSTIGILAFGLFTTPSMRYLFFIIPWTPWVLVHSGWIWKDLIFTLGYGLLSALLAQHTVKKTRFTSWGMAGFCLLLVYATAVKYQAQFIAPFILTWCFYVQLNRKWASVFMGILTSLLLSYSIKGINTLLVTHRGSGSSYSWQYVKIYDLAGISVATHQVLVPEFLWRHPHIQITDIQRKYHLYWEPLIVEPDSPLRATQNDTEREELLSCWKKQVLSHPFAYLKHRGIIWSQGLLLSAPGRSWVLKKLGHEIPQYFSLNEGTKSISTEMPLSHWLIGELSRLTAFIFQLPFLLCFFPLGIRALRTKAAPYGQILLFFSSMGTMLLGILFFFSLAAVPRYIYFTVYLFMLSLPIALKCLAAIATQRNYKGWGHKWLAALSKEDLSNTKSRGL
jgi:hypothetical protein